MSTLIPLGGNCNNANLYIRINGMHFVIALTALRMLAQKQQMWTMPTAFEAHQIDRAW